MNPHPEYETTPALSMRRDAVSLLHSCRYNLHLLHGSSLSVSTERYFLCKFDIYFQCAIIAEPDMVVRIRRRASFVCEVLSFCCFCVAGFVSFFVLLYFPATASSPSGGGAFFVLEKCPQK